LSQHSETSYKVIGKGLSAAIVGRWSDSSPVLWSLSYTASSCCDDHSSFASSTVVMLSGSTAGSQSLAEALVIAVTSDFSTWSGIHKPQLEYLIAEGRT